MAQSKQVIQKETTWGDMAVDGLLAGIVGGIVILAFLLAWGVVNQVGALRLLNWFEATGQGIPSHANAIVDTKTCCGRLLKSS